MKNLKKLISVVLCVAMMASLLVVSTSAANYPDVEETASYSAAVELLSALDILKGDENGNFNPDAEIKRSEFAAVVCRALGAEAAATSTVSKFDDVAANHWAVGYIGWAAGRGIVNGYGDGTFGPDKAVSYQEAVKMIMAALGYGKLAENKGGYPYGYLSLAGTYGVTAGLTANPTEAAPRSLVAQLIYNALEAPIMDTSYTALGETLTVYDGSKAADYEERTILSQYLDIIKVKAEVVANYKTEPSLWTKKVPQQVRLTFTKAYNESDKEYEEIGKTINDVGYVYKEDVKVFVGETDAADLFAQTVDAYLFFNEDDKLELKAIISDGRSIETLVVTKDITVASTAGASATFKYWEDIENDSVETIVDIADKATVYLNGAKVGVIGDTDDDGNTDAEDEFAKAKTDAESITFVGPRTDKFNKIFINDYVYGQVEKIDLEEEYITYDKGVIDLSKKKRGDNFVYTIYKNDEEIALEDVKEGDIISILAPGRDDEHGAYLDLYVSSETITGTVTSDNISPVKFDIDSTEYVTVEAGLLDVGQTGTFYLTADGKIYAVEATSTLSDNYGFILKVGSTKSFGDEYTYQMRLFTKEGTIATYTVAPTLKVYTWDSVDKEYDEAVLKSANGTQKSQMDTFAAWTDAADDAEDAYAAAEKRLITYTLDGDMITKITLAGDVAKADLKKAYSVKELDGADYKPATDKFGGYIYTDATKLFYAPIVEIEEGDNAGKFAVDEDQVALITTTALDEENEAGYDGYVYAENADKEFGAAVITSELEFAGKASALAVVIGTSEGLDANSEKATKVTVLKGGEVKSYVVNENAKFDGLATLASGDIIQFVLNGVDEISAAKLVYDIDLADGKVANGLGSLTTYATTESTGEVQFVYGVISDVTSKYVTISEGYAEGDKNIDYAVNYEEGCTLAKVDATKINLSVNTAITSTSSVSSFRATRTKKDADGNITAYPAQYVMVARVVDGEIVDAVSYQLNAAENGTALNGETYKVEIAE